MTSSGFKNRLYYIGLLTIFAGVFGYYLYLKEPSVQHDLERNAFRLNYAAFKNAIRLYNYRYILKTAELKSLDRPPIIIGELVFNTFGYPIGNAMRTEIDDAPQNTFDCAEIWRNVLGPIQPAVSLNNPEKGYWVELTIDNNCLFRNGQVKDLAIDYNAVKGLVSLTTINR